MVHSLGFNRWADLLIAIYDSKAKQCYCERLCKVVKCSRTYIRDLAKQLLDRNLIVIVPVKNVKRLTLTEKGRKVVESLLVIRTQLGTQHG